MRNVRSFGGFHSKSLFIFSSRSVPSFSTNRYRTACTLTERRPDDVVDVRTLTIVVTTEEVGNVGAFLCSDLASGVTGEITYVDAGYNILGMAELSGDP